MQQLRQGAFLDYAEDPTSSEACLLALGEIAEADEDFMMKALARIKPHFDQLAADAVLGAGIPPPPTPTFKISCSMFTSRNSLTSPPFGSQVSPFLAHP